VNVEVALRAQLDRPIAPPAEAGSIAGHLVVDRLQTPQRLPLAGVERRVDVDEIDRIVG